MIQLLSGYTGGTGETTPEAQESTPSGGTGEDPERYRVNEFPLCPSCHTSLTESASVKTRELVAEDEPAQTITIAYCGACGITLGIKVVCC